MPVIIAGGQTASIAELNTDETLTPLIAVGDTLPGGKIFKGSSAAQVRTLATGEVIFADSAGNNALYSWLDGTIKVLLPNPATVAGTQIGVAFSFDVNSKGELAGNFNGAGGSTRGAPVTTPAPFGSSRNRVCSCRLYFDSRARPGS